VSHGPDLKIPEKWVKKTSPSKTVKDKKLGLLGRWDPDIGPTLHMNGGKVNE